jgi:uncharacterized protein (DUF849 family)
VLKVALNGNRSPGSHPSLPVDAEQLAADAAACVRAGADAVHLHPRDSDGRETLDDRIVDSVVRRVRGIAGVPIGVSTAAWIEPDLERRVETVARWRAPDMASVNLSEDGAELVMGALMSAGIGIEAGVSSVEDAEKLATSGFAGSLQRVLVEIVDQSADHAMEARSIDAALDRLQIVGPRLHHGEEAGTWPVLRQAKQLGMDIRIGLEDTLMLPDGSLATSNEELVRVARTL